MTRCIFALALAWTLGACAAPFQAVPPATFAAYDDPEPFRSLSSDGTLYRVRAVANEPKATLGFWAEALRHQLEQSGYKVMEDGRWQQPAGYWLELAAPWGHQDYTYLVGIFVTDEHIVITEAAGEVSRFRGHRDAILEAMQGVKL